MNLSLPQMRRVATGALVFCVIAMIACRLGESSWPWLAWPRAAFEAATIGALADWFAVVALFRHPMGLPIPHTAILPKNKERVAESLANFLETSFLTEEQLGPRFRALDYAGFAGRWLDGQASSLAERAARLAPQVINGFSDEEMAALIAARAREFVGQAEVGPLVGAGLEVMVQNGRDREIFVSVLKSVRQLVEDHRETIQAKISQEIPLSGDLLRKVPFLKNVAGPLLEQIRENIASAVAGKTIEKVQAALDEAGSETESPFWHSFDGRLRGFLSDLKTSPEMAVKIRTMQDSLSESPLVDDFAAKTWLALKACLLADCAAADSTARRKMEEAILSASRQLKENAPARESINSFLAEEVMAGLLAARPHARELVISTITAWDTQEMAEKLEATVGRDLQFIRLNGTIVGGLMGVVIYGVFWAFGK